MDFQAYEADGEGGVRPARWLPLVKAALGAGAIGCTTLLVVALMALFGTVRWGMAVGLAAAVVLTLVLASRGAGLRRLRRSFRAEGRVLAGAEVTVHAVERFQHADLEADEAQWVDPAEGDLYRVDLTVGPRATQSAEHWFPERLRWLSPSQPLVPRKVGRIDDRQQALRVETRRGGRFVEDLGDGWRGNVRLRAVIRVPGGGRKVRLAYLYEPLAELDLVSSAAATAPSHEVVAAAVAPATPATAPAGGSATPRRASGCIALHDQENRHVDVGPDPPRCFRDHDYGSTIPVVWDQVVALGRDLGLGDLDSFVCPEPVYRRAEAVEEEMEEAVERGDAERAEELRRRLRELLPAHDPAELRALVVGLARHLRDQPDSELAELALTDLEAYALALDHAAAHDRRVFLSPY